MSGEIVNLRRARKRQAAALAEAQAAANRIEFGVARGVKRALKAERDLADRHLDAHRRSESDDAG
jgi:hypothetical protein